MEEALARGVQIFLALAGAYLVALWFALAVWAYRDIGARSQSVVTQVLATLLVLLFSIPGALLYLLLRPKDTLDDAYQRSLEEEYLLQDLEDVPACHACQRPVDDEYMLCPHCQTTLKSACPACTRLVNVKWAICPYCGANQSEDAASIRERLPAPAERFIERGTGTFQPLQPGRDVPTPALSFGQAPAFIGPAYDPPGLTAPQEDGLDVDFSSSEPSEPIRLFDRKKTRMLRAASEGASTASSNGKTAVSANGAESRSPDDMIESHSGDEFHTAEDEGNVKSDRDLTGSPTQANDEATEPISDRA
ncbi:hypothetical protein BH23CHL5_BH23CHL5_11530 [soil metagenome]